jgi:hypothetical protein
MVLPMARPWKHLDTGVYWLSKAVPKGLRALLGIHLAMIRIMHRRLAINFSS